MKIKKPSNFGFFIFIKICELRNSEIKKKRKEKTQVT